MRKMIFATALVFLLIFGYAVAKSTADEMMTNGGSGSDVKEFLGKRVENTEGEFLGAIIDFVSDPQDHISFAILLFGNDEDYPDGGRRVAVPSGALFCSSDECILHSTYAELESSPVFISKDDLVSRQMAENIYRYYGLQAPWTEEESMHQEMTPNLPQDYDD